MQNNQEKEIILLEDLGMHYPKSNSKQKRRYGLYKCFCGNEFKSMIQSINKKYTISCGCFKNEQNLIRKITHNLSRHRIYLIWYSMIDRCTNIKNKFYNDYGGRGITVCDRWLNVANFIDDMYPSYIEGLTIDRENNNKGYSKDNCRWTTQTIQSRNTRKLISTNTSGYRGVGWHKSSNRYRAQIAVNNKHIHIGNFDTLIEAAKAYDQYVIDNNLEHTKNFDYPQLQNKSEDKKVLERLKK